MTALRATFHFRVSELVVEEALLGHEFEFDRGAFRIVVGFPVRDMGSEEMARDLEEILLPDDLFGEESEIAMVEHGGAVSGSIRWLPAEGTARVQLVRARMYYEGKRSASDFIGTKRGDKDEPFGGELAEAGEAAKATVEWLIDYVRVETNQYWLGLRGTPPEQLGRSELVDLDACRRLPVYWSAGPHPVVHAGRERDALTEDTLRSVIDAVRREERPTFARELLVDSAYYLREALPVDRPRAVLTAAIACEVRIKEFLRERAGSDESRELVGLLLASPRDFSMALLALFDRPAKIVAGKSLREDDKPLYNEIDKLIQTRNAIAHRGQFPNEQVASECVRAAFRAFRWIDGQ